MNRKSKNKRVEETPHDMMKRLFAVAELIIRSDGYHHTTDISSHGQKPESEDLMYGINQHNQLGIKDGTEEA